MTVTLPDRPPGDYQQALALAAEALAAQKAVTPQQKAVQVAAAAGERVIAVRQSATEFAIQRIGALWATVNPYDRSQVDEFAAAAARILAVAQVATGTAAAAAIVTQLKAMGVTVKTAPVLPVDVRGQAVTVSDRGAVSVERETTTVDYDGASVQVSPEDMTTEAVMHRPAAVYRRAVVEEAGDASALSLLRIGQIVDEQLMLTQRLAETAVMTKAVSLDAKGPKVLGYRRLIHPEMSRGGTCGLCIAAADRIYHAKKLRPIHALCKCTISPVTADHDPADELNQADLTQLYKDAGGTSAAALKRTRYKVDEHGELGAVLAPKRPYTPRDKAKRAGAVRNARAVAGKPETKAQIAARHLPAMEKNLTDMRARGVPEADPKIIWHKQQIVRMQADMEEVKPKRGDPSGLGRPGKPSESADGPTTLVGGGGGGGGGSSPTGFADFGDDDLSRAIEHGWERHNPELTDSLGTKHPAGTTRSQAETTIREIAAREWVEAPIGPIDEVLRSRLDACEVSLMERRDDFTNVYGRTGDVRYEVRLAGKDSTAHPIDGVGVVRHIKREGKLVERNIPLGGRPVQGWDRPRDAR